MRKRIKTVFTVVLILGLVLTAFVVYAAVNHFRIGPVPMFAIGSIDELLAEHSFAIEDKTASKNDDLYLKDITPEKSFKGVASYQNKQYTIYAYEFANAEQSQNYFEMATGKTEHKNDGFVYNGSISSNYYFSTSCVVFYDRCLYRIEGGNYSAFVDFYHVLTANFSIPIE